MKKLISTTLILWALSADAQLKMSTIKQKDSLQQMPVQMSNKPVQAIGKMKIGEVIEPAFALGEFPGNTVIMSTTDAQKNSFNVYNYSVPNALVDFQQVNYYTADVDRNGREELVTVGANPSSRRVLTFGPDQQNNVKQTSSFTWDHLNSTDEIIFGNFSDEWGASPLVIDRRINQLFRFHHNSTNPLLPGYTSVMISNWAIGAKYLAGDFNGDGRSDLLGWHKNKGLAEVALWTRGQNPTFQPAGVWLNSWHPSSQTEVLVGDFNGDKKDDIAIVHQPTGEWRVALSNGTSFQPSNGFKNGVWLKPWGQGTQQRIAALDIDADGKCDLAAFNFATYSFSAVLSNGQYFDRTFPAIALRGTYSNIHQVGIGKYEGRCMLVVGHANSSGQPGSGSLYITNYKR